MRNWKAWHYVLGVGLLGGLGGGAYFGVRVLTGGKAGSFLTSGKGSSQSSGASKDRGVAQADRKGEAGSSAQGHESGHSSESASSKDAAHDGRASAQTSAHHEGAPGSANSQLSAHEKGQGADKASGHGNGHDEDGEGHHAKSAHGSRGMSGVHTGKKGRGRSKLASAGPEVPEHSVSTGVVQPLAACSSVEEFGDNAEKVQVSSQKWEQVMALFHDAKARVTQWVQARASILNSEQKAKILRAVADTKMQRPPQSEQPDLSWRGVGVYSVIQDASKVPVGIIRIGGGFIKLVEANPVRARFELARLLLQSVAPCEAERLLGGQKTAIWKATQSCLNIETHAQECAPGGFSESTWALSSSVAAQLSPPGCQVANLIPEILDRCIGPGQGGAPAGQAAGSGAHASFWPMAGSHSEEQIRQVNQIWGGVIRGLLPALGSVDSGASSERRSLVSSLGAADVGGIAK